MEKAPVNQGLIEVNDILSSVNAAREDAHLSKVQG